MSSLIDLSHITKPKEPKVRKAWPEGGKVVVPNKELQTKLFLLKKQAKGVELNAVELSLLEAYKHIEVPETPVSPSLASPLVNTPGSGKSAKDGSAVGSKRKREEEKPAVPLKDRLSMSLDELLKTKGKSPSASSSGAAAAPSSAKGSSTKKPRRDQEEAAATSSKKEKKEDAVAAVPIRDRLSMSLDDLLASKKGKGGAR